MKIRSCCTEHTYFQQAMGDCECGLHYQYSRDDYGYLDYHFILKSIEYKEKNHYIEWDIDTNKKVKQCRLMANDAETNIAILPLNTPFNIDSNKLKTLMTFL